ncbi:MAG: aminotransferase class V-fold PLP-dependent enzyme [Bacillota bacterium]
MGVREVEGFRMMTEEERRRQFPLVEQYAYFNTAATGLVPTRTIEAMKRYWEAGGHPYGLGLDDPPQLSEDPRTRMARFIGASRKEVNFVSSTTHGLSIAATSFPLGAGDEVLIPEREFPSVVYPFLNQAEIRGFAVRFVPWEGCGPDLEVLASAMSERTRMLCISWVQYQNGYTQDLEALGKLCRDRGVYLVVDVIQGLGAVPLNVDGLGVDLLTGGTFKWLMAGPGNALLYIRRELIEELIPAFAGYLGVTSEVEDPCYKLEFRDDIERFNLGSTNDPAITALFHSLGMIEELGIDEVNAHVRRIAARVREGALERGYIVNTREDEMSPIVAVTTGNRREDEVLLRHLQDSGVYTCIRGMGLRLAPHFYCSDEDVDRLLDLL